MYALLVFVSIFNLAGLIVLLIRPNVSNHQLEINRQMIDFVNSQNKITKSQNQRIDILNKWIDLLIRRNS